MAQFWIQVVSGKCVYRFIFLMSHWLRHKVRNTAIFKIATGKIDEDAKL